MHRVRFIQNISFKEANERFRVKEDQLPKWISKQISSLTLYDSSEEKIPEKRKYISDIGSFCMRYN